MTKGGSKQSTNEDTRLRQATERKLTEGRKSSSSTAAIVIGGRSIMFGKRGVGNMFRLGIGILAILLWFFFLPFFSFAKEVYRWTDEKGDVHLTDDFSKIPAQYQNQVEKTEMNEEVSKPGEKRSEKTSKPPVKSKAKSDRTKEDWEAYDKKIKQKKAIEGKIEKLEEELKENEKQLEMVKEAMSSGHSAKYQSKKEKLQSKIRDIKKEIADLEKQLDKIKKSL